MLKFVFLTVCLCLSVIGHGFEPPNEATRLKAVGNISRLPPQQQRFFLPLVDFAPKVAPGKSDWLAQHKETPQSFVSFIKKGYNRPDDTRNTIYLAPMDTVTEAQAKRIESIKQLVSIYFGLKVSVLPPAALPEKAVRSRINDITKNKQYHAGDILDHLKTKLPKDAFCLLGISSVGLYPDPRWNFVFGLASLKERVGVYSFVRLDPMFYGEKQSERNTTILRRRATKLVIHEAGHTFGLGHCVYYECALNGSNHLEESDGRPFHLCPICLRKMKYSTGFSLEQRYRKLADYYKQQGDTMQQQWVERRLKAVLDSN